MACKTGAQGLRVVVEQLLAVRQLPHILNEQATTCRSQGPQATVRQADHTSSRTHAARCSVFQAAHEAADRVFHGGRHGYVGVCGAKARHTPCRRILRLAQGGAAGGTEHTSEATSSRLTLVAPSLRSTTPMRAAVLHAARAPARARSVRLYPSAFSLQRRSTAPLLGAATLHGEVTLPRARLAAGASDDAKLRFLRRRTPPTSESRSELPRLLPSRTRRPAQAALQVVTPCVLSAREMSARRGAADHEPEPQDTPSRCRHPPRRAAAARATPGRCQPTASRARAPSRRPSWPGEAVVCTL